MEAKRTGSSHNIRATVNYLGTHKDRTVAHSSPNKRKYNHARYLYSKSTSTNQKKHYKHVMNKYKPYTMRDLRTFSNMGTVTKRGLIAKTNRILKNSNHKVKAINYEISPDPKADNINPNDPKSIDDFEDYIKLFIKNNFNGKFIKTNDVIKSKSSHARHKKYRKYKFVHGKPNQFYWFVDIQPDSRNGSHTHAHLVLINYDRNNGHAVDKNFYSGNHIRNAINRTTSEFNATHERSMTLAVKRGQRRGMKSNKSVNKLVSIISNGLATRAVTSKAKFKRYLKAHHVQFKVLRKTKRRRHSGFKFRLVATRKQKRSRWYTSSRLSKYRGGAICSMQSIKSTLRDNLSHNMKLRRQRKLAVKAHRQKVHKELVAKSLSAVKAQKSAFAESSALERSARSASAETASQEDYERQLQDRLLNPIQIERKYPVEPVLSKMHNGQTAIMKEIPLIPKMTNPKTARKAQHKSDVIDGTFKVVKDKAIKQSWFNHVLQNIHNRIATAKRVTKDYFHVAKVWMHDEIKKTFMEGYHGFVHKEKEKHLTYKQFDKIVSNYYSESSKNNLEPAKHAQALEDKYPKFAKRRNDKINAILEKNNNHNKRPHNTPHHHEDETPERT